MHAMPQQLVAVRIKDGLFVGNQTSSQDDEFLFMNKVTHIVNCAGSETPNLYQQANIHYLSFHWRDLPNTILFDAEGRNVRQIFEFIEKGLEKGECVLVHSVLGVSRSCAVVAAYLMHKYGWSLDNTVAFMRTAHPDMDVKPYFLRQLGLLARRLELEHDIFHPELDVSRFALDNEQWMLRNTYTNSLGFDHLRNNDIRNAVLAHEDRARANPPPPSRRRITFSDTGQGTAVSSAVTKPIIAGKQISEAPEKLQLVPATRGILAKAPSVLKHALQSPDGLQCTKDVWPLKSQNPNTHHAAAAALKPAAAAQLHQTQPYRGAENAQPQPPTMTVRRVDGPPGGATAGGGVNAGAAGGINYSAFQSRFNQTAGASGPPVAVAGRDTLSTHQHQPPPPQASHQPQPPQQQQLRAGGYSSFTSMLQPQQAGGSPMQRPSADPISSRTSSPLALHPQQQHPQQEAPPPQAQAQQQPAYSPVSGSAVHAGHGMQNGAGGVAGGTPAWANVGTTYMNPSLLRQEDRAGGAGAGYQPLTQTKQPAKELPRRDGGDVELPGRGRGSPSLRDAQDEATQPAAPTPAAAAAAAERQQPPPQREQRPRAARQGLANAGNGGGLRGRQLTSQFAMQGARKGSPLPQRQDVKNQSQYSDSHTTPQGGVAFGSTVNRFAQPQDVNGYGGNTAVNRIQAQHGLRTGTPPGKRTGPPSSRPPATGSPQRPAPRTYSLLHAGGGSGGGGGSGRDSPVGRRDSWTSGRDTPTRRTSTPTRERAPTPSGRDTPTRDTLRSDSLDGRRRPRPFARSGDSGVQKQPSAYESWINDNYGNNGSFTKDESYLSDGARGKTGVKKRQGLAQNSSGTASPMQNNLRKQMRSSSASDRQPTASFLRKTSRQQ